MIETELAPFAGQRGVFAGRSSIFAGPGGAGPLAGTLPVPDFWAQFSDLGAGVVDLTLTQGSGVATFTRATTAWTKLASGLWGQVSSGAARSCYLGATTVVGAYGGFSAEELRINQCLQSRDLTATWTLLNATAAKDQVGIDGVTNSASSLTATLAGGSCLQTITEAATTSAYSVFLKRITGTGTITIQQGASTLDVTAQVNSSTYTRVAVAASVLNPIIGIVLGSNGDKIAVDMNQFENGAFATSPIPTTTVGVTRNADVLSYPIANVSNAAGTAYFEFSRGPQGYTNSSRAIASTGASNNGIFTASTPSVNLFDGTTTITALISASATNKLAGVWGTAGIMTFADGVPGSSGAFDGDLGLTTALEIGGSGGALNSINACMKNVKIWKNVLTNAQIAGM